MIVENEPGEDWTPTKYLKPAINRFLWCLIGTIIFIFIFPVEDSLNGKNYFQELWGFVQAITASPIFFMGWLVFMAFMVAPVYFNTSYVEVVIHKN